MVLLSMLLARTIAGPVRRLAEGAESVRRRIKTRVRDPRLHHRRDEIGELSGALREMTNSLYSRIEAIESFAADVAHELKNPLTSLRSAVETMPLAKTPESRARLLAVIEHDVRRLDRLISDVSDASRLDAELQRQDVAPVDLTRLLNTVVTVANEVRRDDGVKITLAFEGGAPRRVRGAGARLAARPGDRQSDRKRALVLAAGRHRAHHGEAAAQRGRDHGRRRRAGHPAGSDGAHLRALLHRPAASGLRPELRPRPLDLAPDRRGAWRPHPRREPHGRRRPGPKARRCSARASWCACRRCDERRSSSHPADLSDHPRLRGSGRRARGADPRAGGIGQIELSRSR